VKLDVHVDFVGGWITEYYPQAVVAGSEIRWSKVQVAPRSPVKLADADGRYLESRAVDAAALTTEDESEQFLFYRGLGTFALPLAARLADTEITTTGAAAGQVLAVSVADGKVGLGWADPGHSLAEPTPDRTLGDAEGELREWLTGFGLYPDEAAAMVATWRDLWLEDGLRLFYVLDRQDVDRILPWDIRPAPSASVRVIVARQEILRPADEAAVVAAIESGAGTEAIAARWGRFAEPLLQLAAASHPAPAVNQAFAAIQATP
jgi:hypothetical protein